MGCSLARRSAQFDVDFNLSILEIGHPQNLTRIKHFSHSSFQIDGLVANTTYSITIVANNTHGQSSPYTLEVRTKPPKGYLDWIPFAIDSGSTNGDDDSLGEGSNADLTDQDPLKLLPIVGAMAGVVMFLILVTILVIVLIRNRNIKEDVSVGKTHISFSADIDREVVGTGDSSQNGQSSKSGIKIQLRGEASFSALGI